MGRTTTPVRLLSVGLTPEERKALQEIAAEQDVSLASIVRDLLAEASPKFREAYSVRGHRSGYGGRPRETST